MSSRWWLCFVMCVLVPFDYRERFLRFNYGTWHAVLCVLVRWFVMWHVCARM